MGKKGEPTGLKRKPAPRFWPIHRKESTWAVKPSPGPHPIESCIPLAIVLRDYLGFAQTRKEAKTIVAQGKILVDGMVRREDDFPVGLMDVVSLPEAEKHFRVLPSRKGLILHPIAREETAFKLCRVENKTVAKNGHVQIHLHDGSNLLVKVADPKKPQEDVYKTFDIVKIGLPEKQVLGHVKMKEKDLAILTGGKNRGQSGRIVSIEEGEGKKLRSALAVIEDSRGNRYQTVMEFVFAIGETEPFISLPEAT